jgi:inosine/xanthosine triphosphatase
MIVQVGSENPVKVKATKNILNKFYKNIYISSVVVHSGVPDQPIGLDQTIEGAINRAREACVPGCDMGIGIESGLLETPHSLTGYVDMQWCAIYDGEKTTLGVSAGFEYPPSVIKEVLNGKEVGEVMDGISGVEDLGEKMGAISFLSQGTLNRTTNTEQCVLMAMIPRLNKEIYFKE